MPKINIDFTKGLVQQSGSGFGINSVVSTSGNLSADATTFLTKITGAHQVTLPASAEKGAIKIVAQTGAGNGVLKGTNATIGDTTFNAVGDGAVCIYNGTAWVVLVSNG